LIVGGLLALLAVAIGYHLTRPKTGEMVVIRGFVEVYDPRPVSEGGIIVLKVAGERVDIGHRGDRMAREVWGEVYDGIKVGDPVEVLAKRNRQGVPSLDNCKECYVRLVNLPASAETN
jgi:hypothetical protein